jgi:hypothetical protein
VGEHGNQGVTDLVQQSAGAIAYVELAHALENKVPVAPIMNRQGTWVEPDISNHWWGFSCSDTAGSSRRFVFEAVLC